MRCETTARQAITPLRLTISTQSLSATSMRSASSRREPDDRPAAEQLEHPQVVLVLGVDRPLRVRRDPLDDDLGLAGVQVALRVAGGRQRRAVGGQALAELEHPVVVEVEVLAAGERAPRHVAVDVDGERRVAARAALDARPLRRGDDLARLDADLLERDPLVLAVLGEVGERACRCAARAAGSPRPRAGRSSCPRAGRSSRRRGRRASSCGRPSATPPRTTPLRAAQLLDLLLGLPGDALPGDARRSRRAGRARSSCRGRRRSRARRRSSFGIVLPGHRLALAVLPVAHDAAGLGELLRACRAAAARRRGRGARRGASWPGCWNCSATLLNASQSVRASHGGGTASLNECTNGCRSVLEMSFFSYQVAAGRTMSE